jgi:hypothetical protein
MCKSPADSRIRLDAAPAHTTMSRMINKTRVLAAFLGLSLVLGAAAGCNSEPERTERWATTENTNVKLDWDKVNEAYKQADGPEDFERRVNLIYEGDEVISVAVKDDDNKVQVVTGFFDRNTDGKVDEAEKIFTIKRELANGEAKYQTSGYGPHYGYYSSPFFSIASGMAMGMMMSSMFSPGYMPMYRTPYVTSPSRAQALSTSRSAYRAANPSRFSKPSQSGRAYGGGAATGSTPRARGGSRFGVRVG